MKKLWMMLLISALMALSAFAVENTVYVTDGGSGDGTTAASPLGSLSAAYTALGDDGGRIVITDTCTLSAYFTEPVHSGKVTLTGGTLTVSSIRFVLNGATTFENMEIHGAGKWMTLDAQFNPVVFGEGLTVTGFDNFKYTTTGLTIVGGVVDGEGRYADDSLVSADTSITVKSGKAIIIGFSSKVNKAFTGTSNITIEGGTLCNIYLGSYNGGSGGNSNLTISGGTFIYNIYSNAKGKNCALSGNINVKITGGDFSAATLERFDGSVTGTGATSVADVRGLANYSTVVEKMEGFTEIITDEDDPRLTVDGTDAYLDAHGRGNVRVVTTATIPDSKTVTGYGTYFIPTRVFTGDGEALERAVRVYTAGALSDGETFSADLMGIPSDFLSEPVLAISFCVVGGEEVTTAQYEFNVTELLG